MPKGTPEKIRSGLCTALHCLWRALEEEEEEKEEKRKRDCDFGR
jgi:hypothetical protein